MATAKALSVSSASTSSTTGSSPHPGSAAIGVHRPYTGREEVFKQWGFQVPDGYRQNHPYDGRVSSFFRMLGSNRWGRFYYLRRTGINFSKIGLGFLILYFPLDAMYCDVRKWKRDNAARA